MISIKGKLVRNQLFVSFVVLFTSASALLVNDLFIFKQSIERNLLSTAKILSRNLGPALAFSDKKEATKVLSSLASEPKIQKALFFDHSGNLFAQYGTELGQEVQKTIQFERLLTPTSTHLDGSHLTLRFRVGQDDDSMGVLYLVGDLLNFAEDYRFHVVIFLAAVIFGIILSLGLTQLIQRSLSEPIIDLTVTAKTISNSGDYSLRMNANHSGKEIAELEWLRIEFNLMLDKIQQKEAKIQVEKNAAIQANQAKSLLLSNMSHELRTPMQGIIGFARLGQQRIETTTREKLHSYFSEISDSGSRLMNLLNDLLDLSKLEAGKVSYSMNQNNWVDTVTKVCSEMSAFAGEKGLKLKVNNPESTLIGKFDRERIIQVLTNLLSNAIKFSNQGTDIRIGLEQADEKMRCQVTNTGVGIPQEELETIFDKFVQSSKTRTGAGGTGLGLAICREIIQQHGGTILAKNLSNGDTQFVFEIPIGLPAT